MRPTRWRGFSLIELLVVVAVISILAAITMPALIRSMRNASRLKCASNLHQLGSSCSLYANQYDQWYPNYGEYASAGTDQGAFAPPELIQPYVTHPELHVCPIDPTPHNYNWWRLYHPTLTRCSYMWSEHLMTYNWYSNGWQRWSCRRTAIRAPSSLGLIADGGMCPNGWTWRTCLLPKDFVSSRIDWHHEGGVNMLYGDQRVEKVQHMYVAEVRASPF